MRPVLTLLALCALPAASHAADVYRCVTGSTTTYQDEPCRNGQGEKLVRPPAGAPAGPPPQSEAERLEAMRARVDEMARERRRREIGVEIDALERSLAQLADDEAAELAKLRVRKSDIRVNMHGAPWELGWAEERVDAEMKAVSESYRARTEATRRRIAELRGAAASLVKPR